MTKEREKFGDLVFTVVDAEDEPVRWRNARLRREKASQPRPVPSCVPDLSLGATEWVYILCLGEPRSVRDADLPRLPRPGKWCVPVSHYVGWTGRPDPRVRVTEHGAGMRFKAVQYLPNRTLRDEEALKRDGSCPACGESLNYLREAWDLHSKSLSGPERERLRERVFG